MMLFNTVLADRFDDRMYSDLTGCFPVRSYVGNQYIFVCYMYILLLRASKNRSDKNMLVFSGKFMLIYRVVELTSNQLVKRENRRINAAEPIVKTAKYLVATLSPSTPIVCSKSGLNSSNKCRTL
ncbi:hypothetical protein ACHAWF_003931 [Thalassiosira exigua]